MKKKLFYLLFCMPTVFLIMIGCNDKELIAPDSKSIEYLSHQSEGCRLSKDIADLEKISDEAIIDWQYSNSRLMLKLLFTSRCGLSFKDSVYTTNDDINIYLCATNEPTARCVCQYKEVFNFIVVNKKEISVIFRYKSYSNNEYSVRADSVITLL